MHRQYQSRNRRRRPCRSFLVMALFFLISMFLCCRICHSRPEPKQGSFNGEEALELYHRHSGELEVLKTLFRGQVPPSGPSDGGD
ncbi:hypothetical protein MA16_Dca001364 [Dendrobium catenatum]|uniref:Uncharacterized protein n=1 Tax=Dendrobium catenatum TaxID=906689 RepID=A0A2I0WM80_9ASPA|nr:hypothetical protein MA16_Dca001364 [Dendrobium catenatum]